LNYTINDIARIINAKATAHSNDIITQLLLDSRKVYSLNASLFFALKGFRRDGHQFIPELYKKGARNFVVSSPVDAAAYPEANFLQVANVLEALQQLAAYHRKQFTIPVIGITGSNGKTIVKEWLYQLLQADHTIVRSPKSYNSQIGVPLSVWQMNEKHTLGIFEAGISQPGEMDKLEKIIQPTIAVLTNIGEAHSQGFSSMAQKEKEKRILFRNAEEPKPLSGIEIKIQGTHSFIQAKSETGDGMSIEIPFTDEASVQNAITCWKVMLMLGYDNAVIKERMKHLLPVNMRLELKKGINHCSIINDSYSADLSSLEIALNFLDQQGAGISRTAILSDFLQSAMPDEQLYRQVYDNLSKHGIKKIITIGERISGSFQQMLKENETGIQFQNFLTTEDFLQQFRSSWFRDEIILVKGARLFAFEKIVQVLEQKVHQTILEINLNAIVHNLKAYQAIIEPSTKVMAMVKAFAYGSGGAEIAGILQYHKADYLGVAYADEGVELRRAGITMPVMVMNPEESSFDAIVEYDLEPELYSFDLLESFSAFLTKEGLQQYPVHIEIETGMNRLGFSVTEMEKLSALLAKPGLLSVRSVFSHLAASEEAVQDEFSMQQFHLFKEAAGMLKEKLGYPFLLHIANSAAVVRHPEMQLDMVRLGIGLYGIDSANSHRMDLHTVATLKSTIAQLKYLKAGESVSYNRRGVVKRDSVIATVRIGYADGYPRRLGNGAGIVSVKGKLAPVIGTVCMDMFMVDVTDIPGTEEGEEVIIFGKELPVESVAEKAGTIPYEIMTGISQRVKRVYFEE
jgi:alanine racemase